MDDVQKSNPVDKILRGNEEIFYKETSAINYERRGEGNMMNSKSEYNRCTLHRITTINPREKFKEIDEKKEEENI